MSWRYSITSEYLQKLVDLLQVNQQRERPQIASLPDNVVDWR